METVGVEDLGRREEELVTGGGFCGEASQQRVLRAHIHVCLLQLSFEAQYMIIKFTKTKNQH